MGRHVENVVYAENDAIASCRITFDDLGTSIAKSIHTYMHLLAARGHAESLRLPAKGATGDRHPRGRGSLVGGCVLTSGK